MKAQEEEEEEEQPTVEVAMMVSKGNVKKEEEDGSCDCVMVLVKELKNAGFIVEIIPGLSDEFIKLMKTLGKTATELHVRKPTYIGMELQFYWEDVKAFVRQPDGSLFSWCERFQCYNHLLYGIANRSKLYGTLNFEDREFLWEPGESLLHALESEGIVKQVFPLHDEIKRKKLLRSWVLNWKDSTNQPIDDMY